MKIIVNRGIGKTLTRILVFKNSESIMDCPIKKDYCEFDAKEGDQIVIKLKSLDTFTLTIASFVYHEGKDTFYVGPTMVCKSWELANYRIFPYFCLLFLTFRVAIESDTYERFCASMIVLTALSLMCLQFCILIPFMQKRLFKLEWL